MNSGTSSRPASRFGRAKCETVTSRRASRAVNTATVGSILYLALFPSILAYVFWNRAVAELGANRTGQFLHLMPVFGAALSMIFLDERLYGFHAVGIALIALGIWLATVYGRKPG